ncbi:MAG: ribonuclease III [Planctomycetes bacterium]|nr:ribonuclease III [Planctomycetota bacterium]
MDQIDSRREAIEKALNYLFRDEQLLARALRHSSVGGADQSDNERLEFLGDAVIGLVVAAWLFERHPEAAEGILTERRARLVSRAHLARVGRRIGLEPLLETRLHGRTPGRIPDSVVCGALEALIGAIYLETGSDAAERAVRSLLKNDDDPEPQINLKAALQHLSQVKINKVPTYQLVDERTHAFGKSFCMAAVIQGRAFPTAWGTNKREAENNAAREALLTLQMEESNPPADDDGSAIET